ncbi:Uncharacterised protein [Dermatophilus congolensis]|uniref:Uncharacterized protein n=1 Tax=Dermatophilus congolensis TaxID=1863 RepID=A0AA46BLA8_9MICO|nr:Uncharacterised protein [Dermatophilus congolensis]
MFGNTGVMDACSASEVLFGCCGGHVEYSNEKSDENVCLITREKVGVGSGFVGVVRSSVEHCDQRRCESVRVLRRIHRARHDLFRLVHCSCT